MRTVGEILKKARHEKKLTLEQVEKILRIRKKFLSALEENAWDKLPSLPYIKGFLKNYSSFLNLNAEEMIAIFRRQYSNRDKIGLLPKGVSAPLDEPSIKITPQSSVIFITALIILLFFSYLFIQFKSFTDAPNLTLSKPLEGEIIYTENVTITGKTTPDAVLSINNQNVVISQNGQFFYELALTPGINTIVIESLGKNGKKRTVTRNIQIQTNR